MAEHCDIAALQGPASAALGVDEPQAVIPLPSDLSADFTDHEVRLPIHGVHSFRIIAPHGSALLRLKAITLETLPRQALPLWQCTKDTRFQGVCQPAPSHHFLVGDALAVPLTADRRTLLVRFGPLPAAPRLLRLNLAMERVSAELADSLANFLRQRAEEAAWARKIAEHEARELEGLIKLPPRDLSDVLQERDRQLARQAAALCAKDADLLAMEQELRMVRQSRSWRLTAPLRYGGEFLQRALRRLRRG
jgi:hypothetical protein